MARKNQRKLWGVLLVVAGAALPAVLYFSAQTIAQNPSISKTAVVKKFVEANDLQVKGEYEKAKVLYDFVRANKNLLTPQQSKDFEVWTTQFNTPALQGRQRCADILNLAEKAIKERRYDDAKRLFKEFDSNPYPSPPQRQKRRDLDCMMNDCFNPQTYRDHLKLGKLAFENGDLDFAEDQFRKSIEKRPFFHPPDWGDTPEKWLEKIDAARHPNAEKKGFFNFLRWPGKETPPPPKDNGPPPKIINFDGSQPPAPGSAAPPAMPPGSGAPQTPPQQPAAQQPQFQIQAAPIQPQYQPQQPPQYQQPLPLPPPLPAPSPQSLNGPYPTQPAGTVRMSEQDLPPGNIVQTAAVEDPQAADLRRQAVDCMHDALYNLTELNDLAKAKEYAERARAMNVKFAANDPNNPDRLLEEIYRREEALRIAAGGKPGEGTFGSSKAASARPRDPRVLIKQARELIKKEQWDEAQRLIALATEAASLTHVTWGLFDDTPDKVQRDLNDKRAARNKEKAVLLMLQARKEFNEKRYAEAKELAMEAKELHGPYTLWDNIKGERAQNLIDEITRLENKLKTRFVVAERKDIKAPEESPVSEAELQQDIARRNRCLSLMDEARTLGKTGQLIQARARLVEAQKLNVVFVPGDQNPAGMLADLQWDCQEALNRGLKESGALLNNAADTGRFQKAMLKLNETMQLCNAFGLNPVPIQQSIAYVLQVQNLTPPPPPELTAMQKEGKTLLDQANFELQKGNLGEARNLAERAFDKKYALQGWAQQMLRSIDVAQREVARRTANDNARSLVDAFRRKDYRQTAAIFKQLDATLIDPNLLDQVREIMSRGEVQAELRPRSTGGFATAGDEPKDMPKLPNTGRSSVGDGPLGTDNLKEIRAMEKVQFDFYRKESINVQQTAIEVCKTDPAGAIARLEDFLVRLNATKFNPNDQDALMKPIENRINQYKQLQAQQEWWKKQAQQTKPRRFPGDTSVEDEQRAERALQDTYIDVQARIAKAGKLYKEDKFEEALLEYKICKNLLPANKAAIIGIEMATKKLLEKEWDDNKRRIADFNRQALGNGNYLPKGVTDPNDFQHTPDEFYLKKPSIGAKGYPGVPPTPQMREIEAKLNEPISVDLTDTTLSEAIRYLRSASGLNIVPDILELKKEGIGLDQRVTLQLETIELKSVLNILLRQLQLTYVIRGGVVMITTERASVGNVVTRVYPIADLVVPIPDYVTDTFDSLHDAFRRHVAGNYQNSIPPSPMTAPYGMPPGPVVSNGSYPGYNPTGQSTGGNMGDRPPPAAPELARTLIGVVTDCVAQNTWAGMGGHGNINFYPLGNALIVNQTEDVHEAINYLLTNLRKMQEVQVAIEMRVLTLSDQFYDLVNMNFEAGNISNFTQGPQRIAGLAPAGTSPDMSIPLKNIVNQFTGPIGIEAATGSIAIGAGFSFLNEIQVHMFMEAARADKRTQFLQNPKIAVMSGQTANLAFNKYRFFNTSATPIQNGAQVFFMPQNNPFPIGITMQVTPIVSADRRFVRLHLVPNITNLVSNHIPQIPVEIPVPQFFDGRGDPGRFSVVKMYFQQPEFETVSLNTTVNVPDGGTVLLGGLKTMAEVRTETGAPVVSQLPFPFNRLFRNSSYSRDARSLMIMVTPRIIINESEADYGPQMPMMPQAAFQR